MYGSDAGRAAASERVEHQAPGGAVSRTSQRISSAA